MLTAIIDWSLRNRVVVLAATVLFIGLGVLSVPSLPIDAFPDPTPIQVQVNTYAPNLSPVEVERQITIPVEQAISGLPGLQPLRSVSKFGLSQVVVTFSDNTDIYFARQLITERLRAVEMPAGVPQRPQLGPVATGLGEVFHYSLSSPSVDLVGLRTLQDWTLRPQLRTVPGTAEINGWGGYTKQYLVRVDPEQLLRHGVTFEEVARALADNNLNVGGGRIDQPGSILLVLGQGRTNTLDEIRGVVVKARAGVPLRLGDVARVEVGGDLRMGAVSADGRGEIVLGLGFTIMGENPYRVTADLRAKFDEVRRSLPKGVHAVTLYERTHLVNRVIDTVRSNLFEGGLLVIAVLFAFLGNLRAGLIVALAIPLSMLFAFSGMLRFGIAASLLSLGALDFGLVVDSSVVMVENVMRHLAHGENTRDRRAVVRDAAAEVRLPTMFGELIIMTVYLPILTLEGMEGKFFRPMALTVIFALAGSLVLSLTVMPVLASLVLPRRVEEREPWVIRAARRLYKPVLDAAVHHRVAVLAGAAAALLAAVILARGLGSEFVPRLSEEALVVGVLRLPGTSLEEAVRGNTIIERTLLEKFPDEVEHVWSRCGTGEVATDPMGPEETDMFVSLKPREGWRKARTQDELVGKIREELDPLPGAKLSHTQPIEQRVNEMISGVRSQVAVKIFGDDYDVLAQKGEQVRAILASIPGCESAVPDQVAGQPVLQIRLRQDQLARHGVSARTVLDLVEAVGGRPVADVLEGQLRFPLVIRLPDRWRSSPRAVGAILVSAPSGERLPLSALADIEVVEGPGKILREASQRRLVVQCNLSRRDLGGFVAEAQQRVAGEVRLPGSRYRIEWGGEFENLQRAVTRLIIAGVVALLLILLLLYMTFGRVSEVLMVATGIPLSAAGGVAVLWLRGLPFSVSAAVGFIALSGVSVLNSMVLVSFIRHLLERGKPLDEAVEEAALTRLRPVLMTALVASLGFVPMALNTGIGAEVQRPLATVVIGGIVSSTLLTLLVLPALYALFGHLMWDGKPAPADRPVPGALTEAEANGRPAPAAKEVEANGYPAPAAVPSPTHPT